MDENINWNCEMEVNLFHALRGHKPVGNKKSILIYFPFKQMFLFYKLKNIIW